jgi:hypothetical protein
MIQEHVIQKPQVARAAESRPIVVGHWTLFTLLLAWLALLASAFTLGLRLG